MMGKNRSMNFIKIFTFFYLLCKYYCRNDLSSFSETLNNAYKIDKIISTRIDRSLGSYEVDSFSDVTGSLESSLEDLECNQLKNETEEHTIDGDLEKVKLNKLCTCKKKGKKGYKKKRGLKKLDAYFEKKIFSHIGGVELIRQNTRSDKNSFTKAISKKYGSYIRFSIFIFFIGGIITIINNFGGANHITVHGIWDALGCLLSDITFYIFPVIILTIIIYIQSKVIKYERLKSKKGKTPGEEHCPCILHILNAYIVNIKIYISNCYMTLIISLFSLIFLLLVLP
ncbi:variable surface protein [Plasmodium gonderi]|uniref:Variable surface protein n=1 Tax=Plasmodium gonderi TaxID=77519 RepID=A0A1Y1JQT6_PLAGO|nr:variable surface protein [Plasmodium gonderi]GAW83202.1 variable surface protein [Plasmodium gonderi]